MVPDKNAHRRNKATALDKIEALQPDLIIANKEENEKGQIEALAQMFPVWTSDIQTLEQSREMIYTLGEILDKRGGGEDRGAYCRRVRSN